MSPDVLRNCRGALQSEPAILPQLNDLAGPAYSITSPTQSPEALNGTKYYSPLRRGSAG